MLQSRQVLEDCCRAMELADSASSPQELRVLWVAAITLARAVGHVLMNVDAAEDSEVRLANQAALASWKANRAAHAIFWDFAVGVELPFEEDRGLSEAQVVASRSSDHRDVAQGGLQRGGRLGPRQSRIAARSRSGRLRR